MKRIVLSCVMLASLPSAALACECGGWHREEFRKAKSVFVGEVISVGKDKLFNPALNRYAPLHLVTFRVERRWKGPKRKEVTVLTDACASMCCRVEFHKGKKYLVYVHKDSFVPSDCSWSVDLDSERAERRLKDLDSFWFRFKPRWWPL